MVDRGQKYKDFPKVHKTWLYSPGENAYVSITKHNVYRLGRDG